MSSNKLHLKPTRAEQDERDLKKARKAARKAAKRHERYDDDYARHEQGHKRRRTNDNAGPSRDTLADSDTEYGPQPAASSSGAHKPDYDYIQAQLEEERFRDKLWGAMGDDEHLDSVEATLNAYAHVPRRWRGGGMDRMDDELDVDPRYMEDEDYAEWIRAGMWRKKHAAEHEEQMRRQAESKARQERQNALREETRRMERAAEEERRKRKRARERIREVEARELYDTRWKALLAPAAASATSGEVLLRFEDVPWPVMASAISLRDDTARVRIEDLTVEAISLFLIPPSEHGTPSADPSKERKEKLRETMLRFHPDKFEGRIMKRVREKDRERVKEAVGIVARTVNTLMGEGK
ncbi:hypothetical protein L226DRAFT_554139 [Lentinus tigrinus ALCF2SS1-7]|uniref:Uncharacterized protein n=1 Tax=Lentinus tigrinus ALCF2SS1-6 TaxID=1328759 RepID=A0A5C2S3R7_9APHY|nr:hypothetical protein L227DRAFT_551224 [Lentinus tigrinus ALCF2SS1-6]RPD72170.1 hypothetical protein L226DRAFT_554139 [Lentinus tigrinus ALCF2SS1-7]